MDEALDLLSDSLGQREPDPDENKPVVDKVKVTKGVLKLKQFGKKEGWEGINQTNQKKNSKPQKVCNGLHMLAGIYGIGILDVVRVR